VRSLTIGGPATILNNSKDVIHAGDTIAWTFYSEDGSMTSKARAAHGSVRRIGIRVAGELHFLSSTRSTRPCALASC
jgi:hypothetical protein